MAESPETLCERPVEREPAMSRLTDLGDAFAASVAVREEHARGLGRGGDRQVGWWDRHLSRLF